MTVITVVLGLMFGFISVGSMALIALFWMCDRAAEIEESEAQDL
jgi:hypothetical protein